MVTQTRMSVMECLKHAEANAITLYLNNKRYHWYTYGPHFRDLHLFFDEMADAALAEIDPFGERMRMLGGDPVAAPDEISQWVTIEVAQRNGNVRDMLEQALRNERRVVGEMREAAMLAEREGDPGTNDLFSQHVQTHEKYAWFIDEFLRTNDGMGR
jgi:starvation-inducible DNA-binding protein